MMKHLVIIVVAIVCFGCEVGGERTIKIVNLDQNDTTFYIKKVRLLNSSDSAWNIRIAHDSVLVLHELLIYRNNEERSTFPEYFEYLDVAVEPNGAREFIIATTYDFARSDSIKIRLNEGGQAYLLLKPN